MTKIAFVFPGQGSQYTGMGKKFYDKFDIVKEIYKESQKINGFDVAGISFEGSEEDLKNTQITQPAIVTLSFAITNVLIEKLGYFPEAFAGHSLGEYSALAAAKVLDFKDVMILVKKRGKFMQESAELYPGGMIALIGGKIEDCEKLVNDIRNENQEIYIANYNTPMQFVLSGSEEAINKVENNYKNYGFRRGVKLNVSGAFHSPFMKKAAETFEVELMKYNFKTPEKDIYFNITANTNNNPNEIKDLLTKQIYSSVLWYQSINNMINNSNIDTFYEVGPGSVLTGLIKQINKNVKIITTDSDDFLNLF